MKITWLLIILVVFILHGLYLGRYMPDDAYISFRYARNFLDGKGLVYNAGERVEGYTNFLWIMLLSGFMRLGFQAELVAQWLGVFFGIAIILFTYKFSHHVSPNKYTILNGLAGAFLASNGAYALWAFSGLETMMFSLLMFLGMDRYIYEYERDRVFPLSSILLALATLTRPEGASFIFQLTVFIITTLLPGPYDVCNSRL